MINSTSIVSVKLCQQNNNNKKHFKKTGKQSTINNLVMTTENRFPQLRQQGASFSAAKSQALFPCPSSTICCSRTAFCASSKTSNSLFVVVFWIPASSSNILGRESLFHHDGNRLAIEAAVCSSIKAAYFLLATKTCFQIGEGMC